MVKRSAFKGKVSGSNPGKCKRKKNSKKLTTIFNGFMSTSPNNIMPNSIHDEDYQKHRYMIRTWWKSWYVHGEDYQKHQSHDTYMLIHDTYMVKVMIRTWWRLSETSIPWYVHADSWYVHDEDYQKHQKQTTNKQQKIEIRRLFVVICIKPTHIWDSFFVGGAIRNCFLRQVVI